jgi:hypothetical protein
MQQAIDANKEPTKANATEEIEAQVPTTATPLVAQPLSKCNRTACCQTKSLAIPVAAAP